MSEKTVYEDGEKMYRYVRKFFEPENIILYAHSLGGAVSSHVLAYASSKGEKLGGIILASPMDNLYSAASKFSCRILGAIARLVSMSGLNTEENFRMVSNKRIPIFLCSGDSVDVLSREKTKLHEKLNKIGFKNMTVNIKKNCDHNDLDSMFGYTNNKESSTFLNYVDYIKKLGKRK